MIRLTNKKGGKMSKYFKDKTLLKEFFSKVGKEKGVLTITKYLSDVLGDSGAFYCHSETKEDLEKDYREKVLAKINEKAKTKPRRKERLER